MDSSFLTFSPKALAKKKKTGNIVRGPVASRLLKQKIYPLSDVCRSPSNIYNIEKNQKESIDTKDKKFETIVIDDSIEIISESSKGAQKKNPCIPLETSKDRIYNEKYSTFSAKSVRDKHFQSSDNDKFEEIRSWLNELSKSHEKKRLTPPWSSLSPSTSVIECSPTLNDSPFKPKVTDYSNWRVPESSSDKSTKSGDQKQAPSPIPIDFTPLPVGKDFSNIIELDGSDDESAKPVRRKKVRLVFSNSESDNESSDSSRQSSVEKSTSRSESSQKSSKSLSDSNKSVFSIKSSLPSDKGSGRCSRASTKSDGSIISASSADKIISSLYGKAWDKESVLTPASQKKKILKKQSTRKEVLFVDKTLSQLYGDNWDRGKVLTPLLNRKKTDKGKENTPPVIERKVTKKASPKRNNPKAKLPVNNIPRSNNTPKTTSTKLGGSKDTKSPETLSFLRSLSVCSPRRCNPKALVYKKYFKKNKDYLVTDLFRLYNAEVFEKQLPFNLKIEWNVRMNRTAGYCFNSSILGPQGKIRTSRIQLSTKVCSSADRVRDTLIHEMCHAAVWILNGVKSGHGDEWKKWTRKAMCRFPDLPRITRCHSYSIETKYTYKCKSCGYSIGRHSKSLDLQRKRCGYCYGEFELLVNSKTKRAGAEAPSTPRIPRAASGFALYVKENYKTTKEKHSGLKHKEIMKVLGTQFAGMKVGAAQ